MKTIAFIAFLFVSQISLAQKLTIRGQVSTSDGKPAPQLSITLKNHKKSTVADQAGQFRFNNLAPGNYTVIASYVGLKNQEQNIALSDTDTRIEFILLEDSRALEEIIVNGNYKATKKESDYISRMPLKDIETPQVYNIVGKEIMEQQITTDYKQSLRNIAGGGVAYGFVNNGFAYTVLRGFWTGVRMRNGVASSNWSGVDPAVVERSEAIKGPAGTLYGNSTTSFGGLINLVTKQPFETARTAIDYTLGSYNLHRLAADVNTPLTSDKSVLFRLNAAYQSENTFMDWGFNKRYVVAPSFLFKINEKLNVSLNTELTNAKMSMLPYIDYSALGLKNIKELPLKHNQSLGSNDAIFDGGGINIFAKADYQISDNWKSTTIASLNSNTINEGVYTRARFLSPTQVERTASSSATDENVYQFQQFFNGDFTLAGLKNKVVLGLDVYHYRSVDKGYLGEEYKDVINITEAYSPLSLAKIKAKRETLINGYQTTQSSVYAAYASSVTNLTDRLSVLLGLRVDRLNNKGTAVMRGDFDGGYNQTAVSPKFGAVYQLLKDQFSVFGNYTNGFQNNAPVRQPDATLFNVKPTSGNQLEFGLKTDLFNNRLSATLSFFDIAIDNAVRTNQQGYTFQDSKQKSKGYEIDLQATPLAGLHITAGYGYNKNTFTNKDENGNAVTSRNYLPADYGNLWITYKFSTGILQNFGLGGGTNYVGEINKYTLDPKTDAYFLTDGTLFYEQSKVRLAFKINNIGNQKIWGINDNPLPTRNFAASVKYQF
jgi:iron complex outermembrane receptor protein